MHSEGISYDIPLLKGFAEKNKKILTRKNIVIRITLIHKHIVIPAV